MLSEQIQGTNSGIRDNHASTNRRPIGANQMNALAGSSRGTPRRSRQSATAWVGAGATLVAAVITAIVAVKTHDAPSPPLPGPTQMGGEVSNAQMSIAKPCCRFSVQLTAYGFKGQTLQLEGTVVDATTGAQGSPSSESFIMQADTDRANADFPVDLQGARGRYYMTFVLRDPNGMELGRSSTSPFYVY